MRIIAVTVTYNRINLLKQNINSILLQSRKPDCFIIVDNKSTDGTSEYLETVKNDNPGLVHIFTMENNTGGSGGFSFAIKKAFEFGADYIWGMDDDAIPNTDALAEIETKIETGSPKTAYFCNTHFIDGSGMVADESVKSDGEIVTKFSFVGFVLPRQLVSDIGLPRKELFIYYDDYDYQLSMQEAGYKIIGIKGAVIKHPYILVNNNPKRLLFKTITIPIMPDWKMYYWMRNNILIRNKKGRKKWYAIFLELYLLVGIFFLDTKQFRIAFKGFCHGIRGISGHIKGCP